MFKCYFCNRYFDYEDMHEIWFNGDGEIGECYRCHQERLNKKQGGKDDIQETR